ncbi:MAG: hypothetical protein QMD80_08025 [archaeon]|nr:hypothetical protein [archaeon]
MHLVEYTYSFLKDGRARAGAEAEERANRLLKCSELALAVHEKIRYIEEGNYTKEEWKSRHEEISQLTSSIWMSTYTIIRKEEAEKMIDLFPFVSLGKWIGGIMLIGFLIGYFMRRYGSIFAFLIGFVRYLDWQVWLVGL